VVDVDGDGFASVLVDAGASHDLDGSIVDYEWRADGRLVSQKVSDTLYLPEKRNVLELRVRDNEGHEDTDAIEVVITPPGPHSENLLDSPGFEPSWLGTSQWQLPAEGLITASNPYTGAFALELTDAAAARLVEQTVGIVPDATYEVGRRPHDDSNLSLNQDGQTMHHRPSTFKRGSGQIAFAMERIIHRNPSRIDSYHH
jgi:hypothetical protein